MHRCVSLRLGRSPLRAGKPCLTTRNMCVRASPSTTSKVRQKKFILVTGGVISGIGKGVTASSIGIIMKMLLLNPTAIKIDPYLNVDAGTMSPFEHGEVFVLDDGAETDLDLGNYERFLDVKLSADSNLTTGKIYQEVIAKERRGEYLGKTVQIIPHITNEIMERILSVSTKSVTSDESAVEPDVCVIELGGTIGDIESMPFVEALRQLQLKVSRENFCLVHISMVPVVGDSNEQKTKPTQHSVKELRSLGLAPDFIVCRAKTPVVQSARDKIALFCNVPESNVLSIHDVPNIFHVPLLMLEQNFHQLLYDRLGLAQLQAPSALPPSPSLSIVDSSFKQSWVDLVAMIDTAEQEATVALVGKYTHSQDSYLSVISALKHACIHTGQRLKLEMIESTHLEQETAVSDPDLHSAAWARLGRADALLVPGGFGVRGIEGKVLAIRHARETGLPFLGVCLGMQAAVIEYTRTFLGRESANSNEFNPELRGHDAAVVFMPEGSRDTMGGTMRLGARKTLIAPGSKAMQLYGGKAHVSERHRHRYEVNPDIVSALEGKGLRFSGKDETAQRMEIVELENHPYFVAVQFHPEFKSRPQRPAPVFLGLLQAVRDSKRDVPST